MDEAGIRYWMTFLNSVAGRKRSRNHAVNSAKIFNQCNPMLVGIGRLTLFDGTPLLEESKNGLFTPVSEKEMIIELKTFLELLDRDCSLSTHHTISTNLSGPNFLKRKDEIIASLEYEIEHGDMEKYAINRQNKKNIIIIKILVI